MNAFSLIVYIALVMLYVVVGVYRNGPFYSLQIGKTQFDVHKVFSMVLLTYLVIIASTNTNNPDYFSYQVVYSFGLPYDEGFDALMAFFRNLGVEYQQFRTIVFIVSYACIWVYLAQIKVNTDLALALYAVYPFFFDAIQLRNLLAFSIIIAFIPMLFKKGIIGWICFISAVLLASTIHKLAIIYIILVYVKLKDSKAKTRMLVFTFIASFLFMIACKVNASYFSFLFGAFSSISDESRSFYAGRNVVRWGFLFNSFMEIMFLMSAYFSNKTNNILSNVAYKGNVNYPRKILQINIIMSCVFPVYLIGGEFYRVFRNLALINYLIPINNIRLQQISSSSVVKDNLRISTFFFIVGFAVNWLRQTYVNDFERIVLCFFQSP